MPNRLLAMTALLILNSFAYAQSVSLNKRPRASELGIKVGILANGPLDAITDVTGVQVGHTTVVRGDNIHTGVTAILRHSGNLYFPMCSEVGHITRGRDALLSGPPEIPNAP